MLSWIFITMFTILVGNCTTEEEDGCKIHATAMHCIGTVPKEVPDTIRDLDISSVEEVSLGLGAWSHIESLAIECRRSKTTDTIWGYYVSDHLFLRLTNLTKLRISCRNLESFSTEAFEGLDDLIVLDLTDCANLRVDILPTAFKDKLPSLEQLILRRIGLFSAYSGEFSAEFFLSLSNKPLHHLDLSGSKYRTLDETGLAYYLPQLRSINVSEGGRLAIDLVVCLNAFSKPLQELREVDISYPTIPVRYLDPSYSSKRLAFFPYHDNFVQNFSTVFMNGIAPKGNSSIFYGFDHGSRLCIVVFVKGNISLPTFCLAKNEHGIPLQVLSIANNGIEDVDESITSVITALRFMDLRHNRLYCMKPGRLENVLKHALTLTEIYLSYNSLPSLPYLMFNNTLILEIIDLSHNNLVSVSFKLNHLRFLRDLKLNNNKMHTIDAGDRMHLQELIRGICSQAERSERVQSWSCLRVDISSNPLDCSCENKEFFEWIRGLIGMQYETLCGIESKHPSNNRQILSKIKMQCLWPVLIATISAFACFLVIVVLVTCVVCLRRKRLRRRKRNIIELIRKYRVADDAEKYPVFLSFSSADDEFIHTHIVGEMNARLQGLLNTDRQCVATGDVTFRPGCYTAEEIIRIIDLSEVVVLCISKSFCRSPWCKDEIFVSQHQRKPMVLMFLEEVKRTDMPKVLQPFFTKYARSKWVKEGDGAKLIPDWQTVCQSIVDLMKTH